MVIACGKIKAITITYQKTEWCMSILHILMKNAAGL